MRKIFGDVIHNRGRSMRFLTSKFFLPAGLWAIVFPLSSPGWLSEMFLFWTLHPYRPLRPHFFWHCSSFLSRSKAPSKQGMAGYFLSSLRKPICFRLEPCFLFWGFGWVLFFVFFVFFFLVCVCLLLQRLL